MTFFCHPLSGLWWSRRVEANLAWFYTVSRWSQQMPKSKHPFFGCITSKPCSLIMKKSKPHRPVGSRTAHQCGQVSWPWHIIGVCVCVCVCVCEKCDFGWIQQIGRISVIGLMSQPCLHTVSHCFLAHFWLLSSLCTVTLNPGHDLSLSRLVCWYIIK